MKQCPSCRTTYTDDTLSYCLADGALLESLPGEQPTQIRSGGPVFADKTVAFGDRDNLRIPIADEKTVANTLPAVPPDSQRTSVKAESHGGGLFKIAAVVVALLLLVVLAVGAGLFIYFASKPEPSAANKNAAVSPAPATSPGKANGTDELRDQIANLQRQLDEQKKTKVSNNAPLTIPEPSGSTTTARANSPTDGFLALRSLPSSDFGDRIARIPHGANVTIGGCGPQISRPGKRTGRWCQARYGGLSGWVFDAYLSY
jgi:hypothetical protein